MTHAFWNAIFQCSLTPASDSKFNYSSFERDPLLLASKLSRAASSGRACQLAEAYMLLTKSADLLRSGTHHEVQLTTAIACLVRAFFISQGFVEVSSLYRTILHDLLQPLIDKILTTPLCHGDASSVCIDPRTNETATGVLATCVVAMRALLITEWEEAVSLAGWAARCIKYQKSQTSDWEQSLISCGMRESEVLWVLHSICSCAYNRLLQRPNHHMAAATAAHSQELLCHLLEAKKSVPECPRSWYEMGWLFWKEGQYDRACLYFKQVLEGAINNDDEIFIALGAYGLAYTLLLGGNGPKVATVELNALVCIATAAMTTLDRYNMGAVVLGIAGFGRPSVLMVHQLMHGSSAATVPANGELRLLLPTFKRSSQPQPHLCASCNGVFVTVIGCPNCRQKVYCGLTCKAAHYATVHKEECSSLEQGMSLKG